MKLLVSSDETIDLDGMLRSLFASGDESAEAELVELDENPEPDLELALDSDDEDQAWPALDQLIAEIEGRVDTCGHLYPFRFTESHISREGDPEECLYDFLLVLSSRDAPFRSEGDLGDIEIEFDEVALLALRSYLGHEADGVIFSKKVAERSEHDRPKLFKDALAWLTERLQLRPGNLDGVHNYLNDGGVDVIAWWRFRDGRPGGPVVLGQSTTELEWRGKGKDIVLDTWQTWIDFDTLPPQRALIIPFSEPRDSMHWKGVTKISGVVLDRTRILELVRDHHAHETAGILSDRASEWVKGQIEGLRASLA